VTRGRQRLRILLTANTAWNLAHFRAGLIGALQADGHEISALAPEDEGASRLDALGVPRHAIRIDSKGTSPVRDARLVADFRASFRRQAPDVVLSYTIKNNVYGGLAARSAGVAFLPNVSGLGTAFLGGGLIERVAVALCRASFRPLPVVIFQNADDRDLFVDRRIVRPGQAVLVPGSGIDLARFGPAPPPPRREAVVFLLIARLLRDKGVVEFVEAARRVRALHPAARFQLLGPSDAENRTAIGRDTVADWQARGDVEYLGTTDDVRPHIAAADCVVLPSYREGTPRTLLEAAAMARPIVATDVPGCREVVEEGVNGLLCRARDAGDLAQALLRMIDAGPERRAAMGAAGRAKVAREFDQARVIEVYRGAIEALVAGPGRGRATTWGPPR
jgi:glycosyltransferase involved in cell wall biosynthesis